MTDNIVSLVYNNNNKIRYEKYTENEKRYYESPEGNKS